MATKQTKRNTLVFIVVIRQSKVRPATSHEPTAMVRISFQNVTLPSSILLKMKGPFTTPHTFDKAS